MDALSFAAENRAVLLKATALAYAVVGFKPFPLSAGSKKPLPGSKGFHDATNDPAAIERLFRNHRGNIGITFDETMFVLDLDLKHDAVAAFNAICEEHGGIPETLTQATPSGGLHLIFRKPPGVFIKNAANIIAHGIDTRTCDGYIAAEPSNFEGKNYAWRDWEPISGEFPAIADCPAWLLKLLTEPKAEKTEPKGDNKVHAGSRNAKLTSIAGAMRRHGATVETIYAALLTHNKEHCEPPLPDSEVRAISKSVSRYEPEPQAEDLLDLLDDTTPDEEPPPPEPAKIQFPEPHQGVMNELVDAALRSAVKPQPKLALMAVLSGMASACSGNYALPSGMRLNMFFAGVAGTGQGKDVPRHVANTIAWAAGARHLGKPASGAGVEDCLESYAGCLIALDEVAHFLGAMSDKRAAPYLTDLAGLLLQLFSCSATGFQTRIRAEAKGTKPSTFIKNPAVNILGFCTPEKLGEVLKASDVESGLLGRFLFCFADDAVLPRRGVQPFVMPDLAIAGAERVKAAVTLTECLKGETNTLGFSNREILIQIEPAAEALLFDLTIEFDQTRQKTNSLFEKSLLVRSAEKLERVAGVLAVWDSPETPLMTPEHVQWASAFIAASNAELLRFSENFMHGGVVQANAYLVKNIVLRSLNGELSTSRSHETALLRKEKAPWSLVMKFSRLSAKDFNEAVEHLNDLAEVSAGTANFPGKRAVKFLEVLQ